MQSMDLLKQWQNGIRIWHIAHIRSATYYESRGRLLGVIVIVLSTLVGTSIFADIQDSLGPYWKIVTGFMSALAAVLASIQTFMKYMELAEKHKVAAQKFGTLRREAELYLVSTPQNVESTLTALREKWSTLEQESPNPPQRIYDKARDKVAKKDRVISNSSKLNPS